MPNTSASAARTAIAPLMSFFLTRSLRDQTDAERGSAVAGVWPRAAAKLSAPGALVDRRGREEEEPDLECEDDDQHHADRDDLDGGQLIALRIVEVLALTAEAA